MKISSRKFQRNPFAANRMKKPVWIAATVFLTLLLSISLSAQQPLPRTQVAPVTTVTVDGSEAMFTTMCAMLAAGFEADLSATDWTPMRAQLRERLQHQQGPAVDVLRTFYQQHQLADNGAML